MRFDKNSFFIALFAALLLSPITILFDYHDEINVVAFNTILFFFITLFGVYLIQYLWLVPKRKNIINTLSEQLPNKTNELLLKKYDQLDIIESQVEILIHTRKKEIEHLQKLETYRKEYIGNVSHELKTPIFNIQGYIQTLLDGGLEDQNVNRKFLERADRSVERMITIVEDLQTITQFETGELELDKESFDVLALAKDVCEAMDMRAKMKGINLTVREMDKIPYLVYADRFRIRQIFANLIVNSIKYGKEGGETKIVFRDNGDLIMVEVSDNGIGIDKKHLPRLFERFYRVDKSRSREQGGSGLGLAIVKHIIEAHRQNINVMSTVGVGSVFSFNLEKAKS